VDIVVKGRNVEVPDHYRQHVADKLHKVERYDQKLIRVDVELFHERNPRQSDHCQRVEITCASRGPVIRAEACAADFYSALDNAIAKLNTRLRRAADRRRVHRGRRAPVSVAAATAPLAFVPPDQFPDRLNGSRAAVAELSSYGEPAFGDSEFIGPGITLVPIGRAARTGTPTFDDVDEPDDQPWHIVREKEHPADPMTVDDALFHMELLGHDFYLFNDKESGRASVVYRRKAYDYGVISLAA
jgi:ribosomal subunit interface protein